MKHIIVICDGMADFKLEELGNKTPLEYAYAPNMNYLAKNGQVAMMKTIFEGLPVGSIVANMGIMGFDPNKYHPNGRASFEALAQGISVHENDIVFRCNLISLDSEQRISDFTSGNISDGQAKSIITNLDFAYDNIEIFPGQSYRNLLVFRNVNVPAEEIITHEPHRNRDGLIEHLFPEAKTERAKPIVEILTQMMKASIKQIEAHNEQFNTKASMIWPWSPSDKPNLPNFYKSYKKKAAIVAAMDFLKGMGVSAQMHFEDIPGATGYIDTSYENKLSFTKDFLKENDLVYVHINSTDEEGHNRNVRGKIQAIEDIDHRFLGPLLLHLRKEYGDEFKLALLPDHITAVHDGHHYTDDIPYLVYGKNVKPDASIEYTEDEGYKSSEHVISFNFMKDFLEV